MKIYHHHFLGAEERKILSALVQAASEITNRLKQIEEKLIMNQQQVNKFVEDINAKFEDVETAIAAEGAEVKKAVEDGNVNTTAFEQVLDRAAELSARVSEIYAAPDEPAGDAETPLPGTTTAPESVSE